VIFNEYNEVIETISIICLAYLVGSTFFIYLETSVEVQNTFLYCLFLALFVVLFFVLFNTLYDYFLILCSCLLGSLLVVRGFGFFNETFPDETFVRELILNEEYQQFANEMRIMIILNIIVMVILFLIGLYVQLGLKVTKDKEEAEAEEAKKLEDEKNKGENTENKEVNGEDVKPDVVKDDA